MVKFIVTIIVLYNIEIGNSIPNVWALIVVIYQNHHYVCRLDISYLILNKSSGREWLELVGYKWIEINKSDVTLGAAARIFLHNGN